MNAGPIFAGQEPQLELETHASWDLMELEFIAPSTNPSTVGEVLTSPRASAAAFVDEVVARVCIPLESPILKRRLRLHRSHTPTTVLSIRCGIRLAANLRSASATLQAQSILMQKLGVPTNVPPADLDTFQSMKLYKLCSHLTSIPWP